MKSPRVRRQRGNPGGWLGWNTTTEGRTTASNSPIASSLNSSQLYSCSKATNLACISAHLIDIFTQLIWLRNTSNLTMSRWLQILKTSKTSDIFVICAARGVDKASSFFATSATKSRSIGRIRRIIEGRSRHRRHLGFLFQLLVTFIHLLSFRLRFLRSTWSTLSPEKLKPMDPWEKKTSENSISTHRPLPPVLARPD